MSPTGKVYAPNCCVDNAALGFVIAVETSMDAGAVVGTAFQASLNDAVGVTHWRAVRRCPLCDRPLWHVPCVTLDAWVGDAAVNRELQRLHDRRTGGAG